MEAKRENGAETRSCLGSFEAVTLGSQLLGVGHFGLTAAVLLVPGCLGQSWQCGAEDMAIVKKDTPFLPQYLSFFSFSS